MEYVAIALLLVILMALAVGILGRHYLKLKESHSNLSEDFLQQTHDLKGLYSAANNAAHRLIEAERTIADLAKKIDDIDHQEQDGHPYTAAIKLVKTGARVEDLVAKCSVSQDEAELLIRLHGLR